MLHREHWSGKGQDVIYPPSMRGYPIHNRLDMTGKCSEIQ